MNDEFRKATAEENQWLDKSCCPLCHTETLREGPCGGLCINVMCRTCGSRWNMTPLNFGHEFISGPLIQNATT